MLSKTKEVVRNGLRDNLAIHLNDHTGYASGGRQYGPLQQKSRRCNSKAKAKTILRLPDLEQSKTAVLHSLGAASSQNPTVTPSTNSSAGIAPNRVCHLTEPLCFVTDSFSSRKA